MLVRGRLGGLNVVFGGEGSWLASHIDHMSLAYCLFSKPTIGIKQLNAYPAAVIHFISPNSINLSLELSTKRRGQLDHRSYDDFFVKNDCRSGATDLNGLRLDVETLAI
jgi:hypothetical protein